MQSRLSRLLRACLPLPCFAQLSELTRHPCALKHLGPPLAICGCGPSLVLTPGPFLLQKKLLPMRPLWRSLTALRCLQRDPSILLLLLGRTLSAFVRVCRLSPLSGSVETIAMDSTPRISKHLRAPHGRLGCILYLATTARPCEFGVGGRSEFPRAGTLGPAAT